MLALDRRWLTLFVGVLSACATKGADAPVVSTPEPSAASVAEARFPISDDPVIEEIVRLGREHSQVDAHIEILTKTIGPRLTSSHNLMRAEQWARDRFESWGLTARLEPWGEMPVGFDRGPWSGGQVAPEEIPYTFVTPAWSSGILGPHRAPAVPYPESPRAVANTEKYAGAWVIQPRWERGAGPDQPTRDAIEAALEKAGAAGIVRADRDDKGELVHTGGRSDIDWGSLPKLVDIRLRADPTP